MTFRTDPEFDDDENGTPQTPAGVITAALAVSVLVAATVSLTVFATGVVPFPFG